MNTHTSIKRRDVLRSTLYAGTAMALPIWSRAEGSNSDIRVAVIGFKGRGSGHIGSLQKIKGVRIVALCDVDSDVLDKKVADLKKKGTEVKAYTDYREMFKDMKGEFDAVTVSTPDHNHAAATMLALKAGKHAFTQKPLTHSIYEARMLGQVARENKLATQMGNQGTANGALRKSAAIVKTGALDDAAIRHMLLGRGD